MKLGENFDIYDKLFKSYKDIYFSLEKTYEIFNKTKS